MPVGSAFEAVAIIVSDMERSAEFYKLLGIDFAKGVQAPGNVDVTLPSGMRLIFSTEERVRRFHPDFVPQQSPGRVTLAFRCSSPLEVDAIHESIVDAGHESYLDPFDVFWGHRYAAVADPDGTRIDLFARNEGTSNS